MVRALALLTLLTACPSIHIERDGRRCTEDGECARGFDCHPATRVCTPAIARGCDGEAACWSEVTTGAACAPEGAFVPCCEELECDDGYRTCLNGQWTVCIVGDCTPSDEICDNQDNDCNGEIDTNAVDCVTFFADTDGDGLGDLDDHRCLCVGEAPHTVRSAGDCDDTSACCQEECLDENANDIFDCREDPDLDNVCNALDPDDDGDSIEDEEDPAPLDPFICRDADNDECDDCSITGGPPNTSNDGTDTDGDATCDRTDPDDDADTIPDASDTDPLDPYLCVDADDDGCDDCSITGGPPNPSDDGTDVDADGYCDVRDCEDDNGAVHPGATEGPLGDATCTDGTDNDCDGDADHLDAPDCWWDASWTQRMAISFDNSASTGDLIAFPVAIELSTLITDFDYGDTVDGGDDLRFFDPASTVPLAYEVETWSDVGTSVVWVRVPKIDLGSATDFIWMYWGNPNAPAGAQPESVWEDNIVSVWHLGDDPGAAAPQFQDSTSRGYHMTAQGTLDSSGRVAGRFGQGVTLSGGESQALRGPGADLNFTGASPYTVTAWIHPQGGGTTWHGVVSKGNAQQYALTFNSPSHYLHYETAQGGVGALNTAASSVSLNGWHHVAIRFNGVGKAIFLDTAAVSMSASALDSASNVQLLRIGEGNDGELFRGIIDEVRVHRLARGINYLRAEYLNGTGGFVSFGTVQQR